MFLSCRFFTNAAFLYDFKEQKMRTSKYLLSTLKENPVEAAVVSHRLMLRAGLIRQIASGIYVWLPTGMRVLQKVEKIIREELNRAGAIELFMPFVQPADLWKESGRYEKYGPELLAEALEFDPYAGEGQEVDPLLREAYIDTEAALSEMYSADMDKQAYVEAARYKLMKKFQEIVMALYPD